ncbi:MAG: glutathione S-transferase C-terminal domain-containing protein [Termitinemataceae bacterium]|nr:MAG: glutathione S-transferase C-terminal domain-containing protein [Termitinemataceae bacterium]
MVATSEKAHEIADNGAFVRQKNRFTTPFGSSETLRFWNNVFDDDDPGGFLPVEAGRYRLIAAKICPWAQRQLIALRLLGLSEGKTPAVGIGIVNPIRTEQGWEFSLDPGGLDPVLGIRYLSEAYIKADPLYAGRATVPAVIDITTGKVVNNDYHRLSNYWETVWKPFHKPDAPDLYPETLRARIDALNKEIFLKLNNGVYRAGFTQTQEAYNEAYNDVFEELDKLEDRLAGKKFLFGEKITDTDIRLYVTLARFDIAYHTAKKCNRNRLIDFPNLWRYAKDLYHIPAFKESTDFEHIKRGYHLGSPERNPYQLLPLGPDLSIWDE